MKEVRTRIGGTIKKEWLDIEPIFRDKGWDVKYDSPVYDENFDSRYEFKKKKIVSPEIIIPIKKH